ncbi:transglutaminase-like domain-containing protein [Planctomicrobium sp. SH664]|uniref:transglutaminase-like domain-containing protein n=1 Tax=Planctomicrobium sp. SH664 TaxID=3448125 RepID=UPI003F5B9F9E
MQNWIGLHRLPSLQRTAAVGMVLLQACALRFLMEAPTLSVVAMILVLLSWQMPRRLLLSERHLAVGYWMIVLISIGRYYFMPKEFDFDNTFVNSELAYELASGSLLIGVWTLWSRRYAEQLPVWFLATSAVGFVFSGDIRITPQLRQGIIALILAYLLCWMAFCACCRKGSAARQRAPAVRSILILLVLTFGGTIGYVGSSLLFRHESRLEHVLTQWMSVTEQNFNAAGFSGRGGLSDISRWKSSGGELQTLRIQADNRPGYMRGQSFNLLLDDRWQNTYQDVTLLPTRASAIPAEDRPHENLFVISRHQSDGLRKLEIWPVNIDSFGFCFSQLGTVAVACGSDAIMVDASNVVQRPSPDTMNSYITYLAPQPSEGLRDLSGYLILPERLSPEVRKLAQEICEGRETTAEKIRAVEDFFHQNFQYQLGVHISREHDRLAYFLLERVPAHCEYFATASAILLRIAGVPTRYVTGFVVDEQNPLDGSWVARRKDAHAWVEAYDGERERWVIVESTPSNGVPSAVEQPPSRDAFDAMRFWMTRVREFVKGGALKRLAIAIAGPLVLLAGLVFLVGSLRNGIRSLLTERVKSEVTESPQSRLTTERQKMDQFLAKQGILRPEHETLSRFAKRLEGEQRIPNAAGVADWYRRYAVLRYAVASLGEESYEGIRQSRRSLIHNAGKART